MNIKTVETKTGLSKRMIRHYEEIGLIHPQRNLNNYRTYSNEDINNLNWIKAMRALGFGLGAIRKMIAGGNTEEILQYQLEGLLKNREENLFLQKKGALQIKKILKSKSIKTETLLNQILSTYQEQKEEPKNELSLSSFFDRHQIVRGRIEPVEEFKKFARFKFDTEYKINETIYTTYGKVFEENSFGRASISMCKQVFSYLIVFSRHHEKFGPEFHKSVIGQFSKHWNSISWQLSAKLEALTEDITTLETIFSPLDLCIILKAENAKKENFQIVLPGQPLVVFLCERSGQECNAGRPEKEVV